MAAAFEVGGRGGAALSSGPTVTVSLWLHRRITSHTERWGKDYHWRTLKVALKIPDQKSIEASAPIQPGEADYLQLAMEVEVGRFVKPTQTLIVEASRVKACAVEVFFTRFRREEGEGGPEPVRLAVTFPDSMEGALYHIVVDEPPTDDASPAARLVEDRVFSEEISGAKIVWSLHQEALFGRLALLFFPILAAQKLQFFSEDRCPPDSRHRLYDRKYLLSIAPIALSNALRSEVMKLDSAKVEALMKKIYLAKSEYSVPRLELGDKEKDIFSDMFRLISQEVLLSFVNAVNALSKSVGDPPISPDTFLTACFVKAGIAKPPDDRRQRSLMSLWTPIDLLL